MGIDIISNNLKQDISMFLEKDIKEINEDDLLKIEMVNLKSKDFLDNETDYTIKDLLKLNNIKNCSVFLFEINKENMDIIGNIETLKYIQFDFCDFKTEDMHFNQKIESLFINHCKNIQDIKISGNFIKNISIIGDIDIDKKDFNIENLSNMNSLEEIDIHNFNIQNLDGILEIAPNLKRINIDGSITNDDLTNLKTKVEISQNEFYNLA